jgi:hypothetical protein
MLFKQAVASNVWVVEDGEQLDKIATTSKINVHKPHPDCIYLRTCAIGNLEVDGPNSNSDAFPYGEFLNDKPGYGFRSFIGKKAFVEHASESVTNAIGDLIDSYLRKFDMGTMSAKTWYDLNNQERMTIIGSFMNDGNGSELRKAFAVKDHISNQKDGSIEVLMKIDRKRAPAIARQVDLREKIGVSMGTAIAYSECSVCGNKAYFEKDYCTHIAHGKGRHHPVLGSDVNSLIKKGTLKPEWLRHLVTSPTEVRTILANEKRTVYAKAFEINYGLQFYELSVVGNPAYNKGYALEKVASQKQDWLSMLSDAELLELYDNIY